MEKEKRSHWFTGDNSMEGFTFNELVWDATGETPDQSRFEKSFENYQLPTGRESVAETTFGPQTESTKSQPTQTEIDDFIQRAKDRTVGLRRAGKKYGPMAGALLAGALAWNASAQGVTLNNLVDRTPSTPASTPTTEPEATFTPAPTATPLVQLTGEHFETKDCDIGGYQETFLGSELVPAIELEKNQIVLHDGELHTVPADGVYFCDNDDTSKDETLTPVNPEDVYNNHVSSSIGRESIDVLKTTD